jgi:hypothetical protein
MFRVGDLEIDANFRNRIVPDVAHAERIPEGVFAAWPALIVNRQLVPDVRPIDDAVIEVFHFLRVEGELVVRIRRLTGVEVAPEKIVDIGFRHVAGVLRFCRSGRRLGPRFFMHGGVAAEDRHIGKIARAFRRRRRFADA